MLELAPGRLFNFLSRDGGANSKGGGGGAFFQGRGNFVFLIVA